MSEHTNLELALADIDNICCIYRSVGEAMYDEPRQRLAGRFAKRLDEQQQEIERLREEVDRWNRVACPACCNDYDDAKAGGGE